MVTIAVVTLSGCPEVPAEPPDAGHVNIADAGPFLPPPDAGFDDAGVPIVVDAGPINTTVFISNVTPPSGPLTGLNRVAIEGDGFTGACSLHPTEGAGECHVFFGDVEGDLIINVTLPTQITVRVPPGVEPGPVDVMVQTSLGIGVLEDGYTYFSPVTLESVAPERGTTEGGDEVTVTGVGLTQTMLVTVGERQVVGLVVENDGTSATFLTPPGTPGRADVMAVDTFGRSVLGLAFTYESPLRLETVEPAVVDDVGAVVELTGSGFFDSTTDGALAVTVGASGAARDNLISEARMRVVVPSGLTGAQDVAVSRGAVSDALAGALVVRPPLTGAFVVTAAVPARLDVDGGTVVTLVGEGLASAVAVTGVTVNGAAATDVTAVDDRTLTFTAPAGTGAAAIVVTRADASSASTSAAYFQPVDVDGVTPALGSADGGTAVTIAGRGFSLVAGETTVTFGGIPAIDVVVVSPTSLTATTAAGAPGPVDVVVTSGGERAVLSDGFRFDAALAVVGVRPSRGAFGGDTFVTVTGAGFSRGTVNVTFDGTPAFEVSVVNDTTLTARTPPRFSGGVVDVAVAIGLESAVAAEVFTYFNAAGNIVGGARGGPIDGAVYVTALDGLTRTPIPGLVAYVGTEAAPIAAGLTNILGQAVISGPDIVGPLTVTVTGHCFSAVTFVDVNATELTALVSSLCPPPPTPPQPGPGVEPATVRGRVFGFAKEFFDPAALDQAGCTTGPPAKCEIAFAQVQTTSADEFSGIPPPGGTPVVTEEGGEYFIANARPERLAIVALAGIFDLNNDTFRLRQMGVRREVFPERGVDLIDQDIELTVPLDEEIALSLPDAPMRFDALNVGKLPTVTRVIPFLQFGGEGAFVYTQAVAGRRNHDLEEMPDVPGEMLTFVAGAYTTDGRNLFTETGTADISEDDTSVTGTDNFDWALTDINGQLIVVGMVFVADRPDGSRFASIIEGCVPDAPAGPTLKLQTPPDFSSTNTRYHIGSPGAPSSEVMQDGVGDVTFGGITIAPVLGLPELLAPEEDGVLVDRMLRWKAAPGQTPTIHDLLVFDPFAGQVVWEIFVDGARTKVILPRVPTFESLIDVLPLDQRLCLTTAEPPQELALYCQLYGAVDEFEAPDDLTPGGFLWQHESIFVPNLDSNNWSLLQIGGRGRRAWTTDVHSFIHGRD